MNIETRMRQPAQFRRCPARLVTNFNPLNYFAAIGSLAMWRPADMATI
ncbi:MAG: hypothetical protein ABIP41_05795 [Croceibacterium sp.]